MTGDFTISATNEVIINLNGHKITNKSGDTFTVNKDSKLTINGNGTVDNVSHGKACIYNNGTVILMAEPILEVRKTVRTQKVQVVTAIIIF